MKKENPSVFAVLVSVFFFWGFVAAGNDILIPVFKEALDLQNWQSQLINFAFYLAYSVGALLYLSHAKFTRKDIVSRIGYQNSIALGLLVSATGTLMFIPAAMYNSFFLLITGLFIVGLGFSLQQTAANPFAIKLGNPSTGSQRLSLAGGINNIGTTIGPIILAYAIFGMVADDVPAEVVEIGSVKTAYLYLGLAFFAVALLFYLSGRKKNYFPGENEETKSTDEKKEATRNLLNYPQLLLGMIGIFCYVGVEVATAGNLGAYIKDEVSGMGEKNIAPYVALYWASLMIGRWVSAASIFAPKKNKNRHLLFKLLLPFAAFILFLSVTHIAGYDVRSFYNYVFVIPIIIIADLLSKDHPVTQLLIFSLLGIISLLIGMFTSGLFSVFAFISVGLFCSTLWPCIFTLATHNLGTQTSKGSSFLVFMIMGGAFISLFQGFLADVDWIGIRFSYFAGVFCFLYLAFYALKMKNIYTTHVENK